MKTNTTCRVLLRAALMSILLILGVTFTPLRVAAGEWAVDGNVVTATEQVGYSPDLTAYSGTVSLRMETVFISGQTKIITTIVGIQPEPGFAYAVKKAGGVNGTVEIEFASATCQSKFSFLYKPGLTRIDYGVMRCR